jgi:hypothetical protein
MLYMKYFTIYEFHNHDAKKKKRPETNGNDVKTIISLGTSQIVLVEVDMFKQHSIKSSNIYYNTAVQN